MSAKSDLFFCCHFKTLFLSYFQFVFFSFYRKKFLSHFILRDLNAVPFLALFKKQTFLKSQIFDKLFKEVEVQ
jgi:hypothetical protein